MFIGSPWRRSQKTAHFECKLSCQCEHMVRERGDIQSRNRGGRRTERIRLPVVPGRGDLGQRDCFFCDVERRFGRFSQRVLRSDECSRKRKEPRGRVDRHKPDACLHLHGQQHFCKRRFQQLEFETEQQRHAEIYQFRKLERRGRSVCSGGRRRRSQRRRYSRRRRRVLHDRQQKTAFAEHQLCSHRGQWSDGCGKQRFFFICYGYDRQRRRRGYVWFDWICKLSGDKPQRQRRQRLLLFQFERQRGQHRKRRQDSGPVLSHYHRAAYKRINALQRPHGMVSMQRQFRRNGNI
nr:MAG TPA: hypothetical protein [Caudoviricetes sp.]